MSITVLLVLNAVWVCWLLGEVGSTPRVHLWSFRRHRHEEMEGDPSSSQRDFHLRAKQQLLWKLNGSVLGYWEEQKSCGFSPMARTGQQHPIPPADLLKLG